MRTNRALIGMVAAMVSMTGGALATSRDPSSGPSQNGQAVAEIAARLADRNLEMRWRGAPTKSAPVDVNTRSLDFGTTVVGGRTIRVLTLSNTAAFTLTVKAARFNGSCFDVAPTASLPLVIPPKGQAELPVVFSPASPGICPGTLVLEVDSAGGRFKQVRLEGRGK